MRRFETAPPAAVGAGSGPRTPETLMDENRKKALEPPCSQIEKQFGKGAIMRWATTAQCADRRHLHRLPRPGPGPGRGRRAAGAGDRDLRPRVLGQDDPGPAHHRRGPAGGRHGGLHRRRARPGPGLRPEARRRHRRPAGLPARHRRAGPRDRRDAGALRGGGRGGRGLGGGPGAPAEIEGEMGDTHVGLQARLMCQALRKLTATIKSPTPASSSSTRSA